MSVLLVFDCVGSIHYTLLLCDSLAVEGYAIWTNYKCVWRVIKCQLFEFFFG